MPNIQWGLNEVREIAIMRVPLCFYSPSPIILSTVLYYTILYFPLYSHTLYFPLYCTILYYILYYTFHYTIHYPLLPHYTFHSAAFGDRQRCRSRYLPPGFHHWCYNCGSIKDSKKEDFSTIGADALFSEVSPALKDGKEDEKEDGEQIRKRMEEGVIESQICPALKDEREDDETIRKRMEG